MKIVGLLLLLLLVTWPLHAHARPAKTLQRDIRVSKQLISEPTSRLAQSKLGESMLVMIESAPDSPACKVVSAQYKKIADVVSQTEVLQCLASIGKWGRMRTIPRTDLRDQTLTGLSASGTVEFWNRADIGGRAQEGQKSCTLLLGFSATKLRAVSVTCMLAVR